MKKLPLDQSGWGQLIARGLKTKIPYAREVYDLFADEAENHIDAGYRALELAHTPMFEARFWQSLWLPEQWKLEYLLEVGTSHAPTGLLWTDKPGRECLATGRGDSLNVTCRWAGELGRNRPNLTVAELDLFREGMFGEVMGAWNPHDVPTGVIMCGVMVYWSPDQRMSVLKDMYPHLLAQGGCIFTSDNYTKRAFEDETGQPRPAILEHGERVGAPVYEYAPDDLQALEDLYRSCGYHVQFKPDMEIAHRLTCRQEPEWSDFSKLQSLLRNSYTAVLTPQ